ncbi:MAG TPA: matrixin family metalloprotease [Candidatus Limnocylindria bacterium]|nr:matrixin family metalloprotease [Candidatus Limnocylindria bacterium]
MLRRGFGIGLALALVVSGAAPVAAGGDHATLVDVHAIQVAKARPGPATANCSNDGSSNNQYALTGWAVQGNQTAHLTTGTIPSGLGTSAVTTAMQAGFNAWRGSGAPSITVATDGTATKYGANHRYELMFGRTGGSTIAVTYTWRWSDGSIESDTVFNSRLPWFVASSEGDGCYEAIAKYDVGNIATHEFGHTYGLDHASSDRFETMYPYGYTGETLKRSPENGDLSGIAAVY